MKKEGNLKRVAGGGKAHRVRLTKEQRRNILHKTSSRCHICGGKIRGEWQADHVFSHSKGGAHAEDNYLAAHPSCNNYRWDYDPSEILEIMRLGIWLRTQIINRSDLGMAVAERFLKYEESRIRRKGVGGYNA